MPDVVVNAKFGGFSLSDEAVHAYAKRKGWTIWMEPDRRFDSLITHHFTVPPDEYYALHDEIEANMQAGREDSWKRLNDKDWVVSDRSIKRDDPDLVAVVRDLGSAANGRYAALAIVQVPDGVAWHIEEYDGTEHVAEDHRTWFP